MNTFIKISKTFTSLNGIEFEWSYQANSWESQNCICQRLAKYSYSYSGGQYSYSGGRYSYSGGQYSYSGGRYSFSNKMRTCPPLLFAYSLSLLFSVITKHVLNKASQQLDLLRIKCAVLNWNLYKERCSFMLLIIQASHRVALVFNAICLFLWNSYYLNYDNHTFVLYNAAIAVYDSLIVCIELASSLLPEKKTSILKINNPKFQSYQVL